MTDRDVDRRKFITTFGAGIASVLAGCTGQAEETSYTNRPGPKNSTPDPKEYTPEDSQYVENGEMTVRPYLGVYDAYYRIDNKIYVTMSAMPSPVENYNITVHYTPLEDVESEWRLRTAKNQYLGTGEDLRYNDASEEWESKGRDPHRFYERQVSEHGEQFDTIEVPSSAAGVISKDVTNPLNDPDAKYTRREVKKADSQDPAGKWFMKELNERISGVGIDYHPAMKRIRNSTVMSIFEQLDAVGAFPTDDIFPHIPPYVVGINVDDLYIPKHKPFVLTFGIEADKAPHVESDEVIAQTPQMHTMMPSNGLVRPTRIPINGNPQAMKNSWGNYTVSPSRGETDRGLYIPAVKNYGSSGVATYNTQRRGVMRSKQHHPDKTRVSRISNYSRFSPYLKDLIERWEQYGKDINDGGLSLHELVSSPNFNSPVQNLWSIEYEVDKSEMQKAREDVSDVKITRPGASQYEEMVQRPSVKNHETVKSVAESLGRVCRNINATHPSDKVRVVADFIQQFPYFDEKYDDPRTMFGTEGPQHPVWTLYYRAGDCQDFSVLMNAILRQNPFNMNPSYGFCDDFGAFSNEIDGHMASVVSMEDLGVSSYEDSFRYNPRDNINENLGYTKDGEKYAYVESVSPFIIGRTINAYGEVSVEKTL